MEKTEAITRISDVRTVGVPVRDQEAALAFYVGRLGFEKRMDVPFRPGERWIEVAPAGAKVTIALVRAAEGSRVGVDTGIRLSTKDARADHQSLRAAGFDVDAEVTPYPVPMFTFRDQDGNRLVIVES